MSSSDSFTASQNDNAHHVALSELSQRTSGRRRRTRSGGELPPQPTMGSPGERMPDQEREAEQEGDRRDRAEEEANPQPRLLRLHDVGHISKEFERPAADGDPQRARELRDEGPHAVVDPLSPLPGHYLVMLDDIGQHAPGKHPLPR